MKKAGSFQTKAKAIAKKEGVSLASGQKILASAARKASPAAVKANPNLRKVTGMKKK